MGTRCADWVSLDVHKRRDETTADDTAADVTQIQIRSVGLRLSVIVIGADADRMRHENMSQAEYSTIVPASNQKSQHVKYTVQR